ncbi:MAG: NAD(P)H-dependent oxidoreductase [Oscillospiraceae bacterium]
MRTVIVNASAHRGGDTDALVRLLSARLSGETVLVCASETDIAPCSDCRYCFSRAGCAVSDGAQTLFAEIDRADTLVLASPVWFSGLSGEAVNLFSRLQSRWASRFIRKDAPPARTKTGVLLLAAGNPRETAQAAMLQGARILKCAGADEIHTALCAGTDQTPPVDNQAFLCELEAVCEKLRR